MGTDGWIPAQTARRVSHALMQGIAGHKSRLTWAVNITVALMVVLWLVPTLGLLVSSFRTPDQIAAEAAVEALPEVEDEWDPFEDE